MAQYGLLVDHEWCTGCFSCEMACQMEQGLPIGQTGIKVAEIGPWEISEDVWQYTYIPVPTDQCNFCRQRIEKGKAPTCVKHCQAKCLSYGTIEELSKELGKKAKQSLFVIE